MAKDVKSPSRSVAAQASANANADHERTYRAKEALHTITRAQEHMKDKALMRDVKKCARDQMKTLSAVTGKKGR